MIDAADLLARAEALGVTVELAGPDRLRAQPAKRIPPELREELRASKAEILALLAGRRPVGKALPGSTPAEPRQPVTAAEIAAMPLSTFAGAGLRLRVRSRVLAETVILASDNAMIDPADQRDHVVYRAHELAALLGTDPDELRLVHATKRTFHGSILADGGAK